MVQSSIRTTDTGHDLVGSVSPSAHLHPHPGFKKVERNSAQLPVPVGCRGPGLIRIILYLQAYLHVYLS